MDKLPRPMRSILTRRLAQAIALFAFIGTVQAQAQAGNPERPPLVDQHVAGNVYALTGGGFANISLLAGEEGTLLVDSKSADITGQIIDIVERLSPGPIRFLVNGHEHPDHTDGNGNFGLRGVTIIGHVGVRDVLAAGQRGGPPSPAPALPTVTFEDGGGLTLNLNGERVNVFHAPPAHSSTNSIVHYVDSNVLHLGDLYGPGRYQLIVSGTFQGFIDATDIALALADANTKIIPGVGPIVGRTELLAYREMLVTVRDRIAALVAEGKTLDEVKRQQPEGSEG